MGCGKEEIKKGMIKMYRVLISFITNKDTYVGMDGRKGEILPENFAEAEVIADLLEAGYIEEIEQGGGSGEGADLSEYFEITITPENSEGFGYYYFLKKTPTITVSNDCTNLDYVFDSSVGIPNVKLEGGSSNLISMSRGFADVAGMKNIDISGLNTSNVTDISQLFSKNVNIETINMSGCDLGKVVNVSGLFSDNSGLTSLIFGVDLGKGYSTSATENYSNYKLDLHDTALNHDSLMSVINNLYDIATAGVQPQQLVLGNTLKAKLSAEEIAIATNKGWTVS